MAKSKHLVKRGRKTIGFVYKNSEGWWYAFGRPSQDNWIAFKCRSKESGIAAIRNASSAWTSLKTRK